MMPKEGEGDPPKKFRLVLQGLASLFWRLHLYTAKNKHPPKKFRLVLQGLASLFWRLHLYTALPRVGQPFILKFGQDLYNLKNEGLKLVTIHLSLV